MKQKKNQSTEQPAKKNFRPRKQPIKPRHQSKVQAKENQENPAELFSTAVPEIAQPAPLYELPSEQEIVKPLSFSRIIPSDDILLALEKASYQVPSELLLNVLPAALRGSDTFIYKSKQQDGFLIGVIPAISKLTYVEYAQKKE